MNELERKEIDIFVKELIEKQELDKSRIIHVLQTVQERFKFISPESIEIIARHLNISSVEIFGVATFYEQFRFNKPGKHTIKVCEGTACHVKGGAAIVEVLERELGIVPGETTEDGTFGLERVACLGCCALAPALVIDEQVYGEMTTAKLAKTLDEFRNNGGGE